MAALSFAAFMDALKDDLEGHTDLTGVKVTSFPTVEDAKHSEGVEFLSVEGDTEFFAMGPSFWDAFTLEGRLWARAGDDNGEAGTPSRDRAVVMLEALVSVFEDVDAAVYQVAPSVGARLSRYAVTPRRWPDDQGWRVEVEFSIEVKASASQGVTP